MDQVEHGLRLLRPPRISPDDFKMLIRKRGWRMADVAVRWNVRPETLSRVAADAGRETRWDEMARALPQITRRDRAAATAARLSLYPPRPRSTRTPAGSGPSAEQALRPATPAQDGFSWTDPDEEECASLEAMDNGFRYQGYVGLGSELVMVTTIGGFAAEGATLVVIDLRLGIQGDGGTQEEYLCRVPQGPVLWLTPAQMDDWVVSTGKTRVITDE